MLDNVPLGAQGSVVEFFVPTRQLALNLIRSGDVAALQVREPDLDEIRREISRRVESYFANLANRAGARGTDVRIVEAGVFADRPAKELADRLRISSTGPAWITLGSELADWLREAGGRFSAPWGSLRLTANSIVVEPAQDARRSDCSTKVPSSKRPSPSV